MQAKRQRKEERARIRQERAELRHDRLVEVAAAATKPEVEGYSFRYEPRIGMQESRRHRTHHRVFNEAFLLATVNIASFSCAANRSPVRTSVWFLHHFTFMPRREHDRAWYTSIGARQGE